MKLTLRICDMQLNHMSGWRLRGSGWTTEIISPWKKSSINLKQSINGGGLEVREAVVGPDCHWFNSVRYQSVSPWAPPCLKDGSHAEMKDFPQGLMKYLKKEELWEWEVFMVNSVIRGSEQLTPGGQKKSLSSPELNCLIWALLILIKYLFI